MKEDMFEEGESERTKEYTVDEFILEVITCCEFVV